MLLVHASWIEAARRGAQVVNAPVLFFWQAAGGMRAQVIDNARERWDKDADKSALRKRVTFAGGDFFKQGAAPCCPTTGPDRLLAAVMQAGGLYRDVLWYSYCYASAKRS